MDTERFIAIIVPDEKKAYESVAALQDLHRDGNVSVYATAVVKRGKQGTLEVKQPADPGPVGLGLGGLLGLMIGAFGGPVGVAVGGAAASALGGMGQFTHSAVSEDFVEDIAKQMKPGDFAVVSEVSEEWTAPIDTRIAQLGGTVIREERAGYVEELLQRQVDRDRSELHAFKSRMDDEKTDRMAANIEHEIESSGEKLRNRAAKMEERIDRTKQELDAKLNALQQQAMKASPDIRSRIEQRISDLRVQFNERAEKLRRAFEMAQEALTA